MDFRFGFEGTMGIMDSDYYYRNMTIIRILGRLCVNMAIKQSMIEIYVIRHLPIILGCLPHPKWKQTGEATWGMLWPPKFFIQIFEIFSFDISRTKYGLFQIPKDTMVWHINMNGNK